METKDQIKLLISKQDFSELQVNDKISLIQNGDHKSYWFVGQHPGKHCERYFIAISTGNVTTAVVFKYPEPTEEDVINPRIIWMKGYNTQKVGRLMMNQLTDRLDSIRRIYSVKEIKPEPAIEIPPVCEVARRLIKEIQLCNNIPVTEPEAKWLQIVGNNGWQFFKMNPTIWTDEDIQNICDGDEDENEQIYGALTGWKNLNEALAKYFNEGL